MALNEDFTYDDNECSVFSPFTVQAVDFQVLDVVNFLQPFHVVFNQVIGSNMCRPIGLEHVSELDQAILRNFNQFVLGVGVFSVVSVSLRHFVYVT